MTDTVYWVISAGLALIPGVLYALGFYLADIYEREPYRHVFGAFLWGALPALLIALFLDQVLSTISLQENPLLLISAATPLVEETVKGLAVAAIYLFARQEFDGPLDGLIYGALVGFGFAMTENISYFVAVAHSQGLVQLLTLALLRVVVFGLSHATYTALTGIGLGLARHSSARAHRAVFIVAGWLLAVVLHGAHNLSGHLGGLAGLVAIALAFVNLAGIYIAFQCSYQLEVGILKKHLRTEIGGILSLEEYANLTAAKGRPRLLDSQFQQQAARLRLAVELANRKHRMSTFGAGGEAELPAEIAAIRAKISALHWGRSRGSGCRE